MISRFFRVSLFFCYNLLWIVLLPALALSQRLRQGFWQRLFPTVKTKTVCWIQAASVGEAYLAVEIVNRMEKDQTFLVTSCTSQGLSILHEQLKDHSNVTLAYFPFDIPIVQARLLKRIQPMLVCVLETELWPGLLYCCKKQGIPLIILNGRMSASSSKKYARTSFLWNWIAPVEIHAISEKSGARFMQVFQKVPVKRMPNIKFDRIPSAPSDNQDQRLPFIPHDSPFVVFGSVRKEEEPLILQAMKELLREHPALQIGLFPRHDHRVNSWLTTLNKHHLDCTLRSQTTDAVPGQIILWDTFGELSHAYAKAQAAYIGGSLVPLGGQNFLEPLMHGTIPCIGKHWDNFEWVGQTLFDLQLVIEVDNVQELVHCLGKTLTEPPKRSDVKDQFLAFIRENQGGADLSVNIIQHYLGKKTQGNVSYE